MKKNDKVQFTNVRMMHPREKEKKNLYGEKQF